jgi:hydrogenase nickel incorporation protein HypA/HybF
MHEYSIVQALLERVEQEARAYGASRVHRVRVAIGELAGVEVDLLQTAYDTVRRRTVCDGAPLEIRRVEARWECGRCRTAIAKGMPLRCAGCGLPARLASGDEILLDQIELEAAPPGECGRRAGASAHAAGGREGEARDV